MRGTRLIPVAAVTAAWVALAGGLQAPGLAHAGSALTPQSSIEQMVDVIVTPRDLVTQSWEFEVVLNTHVKPLEDDLMKSSALVCERPASRAARLARRWPRWAPP